MPTNSTDSSAAAIHWAYFAVGALRAEGIISDDKTQAAVEVLGKVKTDTTATRTEGGHFVALSDVLAVVNAEPEFPDPCPKLREFIAKAVETKDEDWILHMMRETVRKTKDSIAAKLNT